MKEEKIEDDAFEDLIDKELDMSDIKPMKQDDAADKEKIKQMV